MSQETFHRAFVPGAPCNLVYTLCVGLGFDQVGQLNPRGMLLLSARSIILDYYVQILSFII